MGAQVWSERLVRTNSNVSSVSAPAADEFDFSEVASPGVEAELMAKYHSLQVGGAPVVLRPAGEP